ncbi:MAG: pilus assembly protein PilM [Nitrospiraceae bacterium]|nr:pilus assembly protein PilM [Nitrospiraceae bacterium]
MLNLFRTAPYGIDMGSGSVKVIGLKSKKISLAAFTDIPFGAKHDESLLAGRLRQFFSEINISGRDAVVNLPGAMCFIRTITLPPMPKGELHQAVQWEIKRQIPYSLEDAVYDYVTMETKEGIIVTFASAEKNNVQSYISPIKEAGVNVMAVDVSPLCILRSLPLKGSGNIIILDIGHKNMEINISNNNILRFTRSVELGGENIKDNLLTQGYSGDEAEKIMMGGPVEKIKDILDQFVREIFRSTDYFKVTSKERSFSEVVLTGGVAINYAIINYISHLLDVPVRTPNPFDGLVLKDEALRPLGPRFSVAIGLARRNA